MTDPSILLEQGLSQLSLPKDEKTISVFLDYMERVLYENQKINLTAITDPTEFVFKHYIDSLVICGKDAVKNASSVLDVGTGGGFPGIPLAIVYPDKEFVLMDSLNKRILFLQETAKNLGLQNVRAVHGRAEDLGRQKMYREAFDLCVSRAVARLSVLSEYCLPFVKVGGWFAAYKTSGEDLSLGEKAITLLGGIRKETDPFPDFSGELSCCRLSHTIVYIQKIKHTPAQYPRKAGQPTKTPL